MSIEKPREFVTLGEVVNREVQLCLGKVHIQVVGDRQNLDPTYAMRRQYELNYVIERRLAELEIGQEKPKPASFRCMGCQHENHGVAYHIDLNGPFCSACHAKGHVGHPATQAPQPQEPSLTQAEIDTTVVKAIETLCRTEKDRELRVHSRVAIYLLAAMLYATRKGKVAP